MVRLGGTGLDGLFFPIFQGIFLFFKRPPMLPIDSGSRSLWRSLAQWQVRRESVESFMATPDAAEQATEKSKAVLSVSTSKIG